MKKKKSSNKNKEIQIILDTSENPELSQEDYEFLERLLLEEILKYYSDPENLAEYKRKERNRKRRKKPG